MTRPQKYRDVVKFLKSQGWVFLRAGKGSHEIWGDPDSGAFIAVPAHKQVSAGIIRQIVRVFPDVPEGWK